LYNTFLQHFYNITLYLFTIHRKKRLMKKSFLNDAIALESLLGYEVEYDKVVLENMRGMQEREEL